jgi:acylphosphatase
MTPNSKPKCRRFRVIGNVQGVFFRASTRDEARKLGITGHAVNLPDGSVEVLACGTSEALQSLRIWLHEGPAMARVDELREIDLDCDAPPAFTTG